MSGAPAGRGVDGSADAALASGGGSVRHEKVVLLRGTVANAAAQLSVLVVGVVFMPMLVRAFGVATYGLYVLVAAIVGYASLADFGVGTAVVRAVSEARATGDVSAREGAVSTALAFYAVVGLLAALAVLAVAAMAPVLFRLDARQARLVFQMLTIGALLQLWEWPASAARHVLAGLQRYDIIAGTTALTAVGTAAAAWAVVSLKQGPVAFMAGSALAIAAGSLGRVIAAGRLKAFGRLSASLVSAGGLRGLLAFGWAPFAISLSDVLFYQHTDRVILGAVLGAVAVGLYEASAKVNQLLTYMTGLGVGAVLPSAAKLDATSEHRALDALFMRGSRYLAALIAPVALVLVVLAKPLLEAWMGHEFASQANVMRTLVFPHILISMGVMGDAVLVARGKMGGRVPYIIAQAVLNVALGVTLVQPRFGLGIIGVAIATAVAHLVDLPIHVHYLLKHMRVGLGRWMREVVLPVYVPLLAPLVLALALSRTALVGSLAGVAVAALAALLVYWALFYRLGMSEAERDDLRGIASAAVGSRS